MRKRQADDGWQGDVSDSDVLPRAENWQTTTTLKAALDCTGQVTSEVMRVVGFNAQEATCQQPSPPL